MLVMTFEGREYCGMQGRIDNCTNRAILYIDRRG